MPAVTSILLATAIGAGVLGAVGSIQKGNAAGKAADFDAALGEQNANLAEQQGAQDAQAIRIQSRKNIGGIHASIGASGLTADSGSAMDVLQESAANGEMDALRAKHAGDLKAWSYRTGAEQSREAGDSARTTGYLGAASSILGAGASVASQLKRGT